MPDDLSRLGRSAGARHDDVVVAARRLRDGADGLVAAGVDGSWRLEAMAVELLRVADAGARLDDFGRRVGVAFAAADMWVPDPGGGAHRPHAWVLGDPRTASHVIVVVPGMGSDSGDGADLRRYTRSVYDRARALDPHVVVVAWLDYEPPHEHDVLLVAKAKGAGPRLAAFVASLGTTAPVSVVAHSYGTIATIEAMRAGMAVDSVVLVGSPGVGADSVDDLPTHGARVFVERAPLDPVALSEAYGRSPDDPRFGAERLATGEGVSMHSGYFDDGSMALANIAAAGVGRYDLLVRDEPGAVEEAVAELDGVGRALTDPLLGSALLDGADLANRSLDVLEGLAPPPLSPLVDVAHDARHAVAEEAARVVSVVQRIASIDFIRDVGADLWQVGAPDALWEAGDDLLGRAVPAWDLTRSGREALLDSAGDAAGYLGDAVDDLADLNPFG